MADRKPPRRRCKAATKAGNRCRAAALKESDYCRAHDPLLPASARFGSPEQAAAAGARADNRIPKVTELLRERIEERADEIIGAYLDALAADRSGEPDHAVRVRAADAAMDRVYGKPKQAVEHQGPDGGAIPVETSFDFGDEKTRALAHELLERRVRGAGGP